MQPNRIPGRILARIILVMLCALSRADAQPLAPLAPNGRINDDMVSVVYHAATGEFAVDPPAGLEFTSINIDSASGIFPLNVCPGSTSCDADSNIFKATFGSSFGFFSFGNLATRLLTEDFLLSDLVVVGSFAGGGEFREADLVYIPVPEPSSNILLIVGLLALLIVVRQQRQAAVCRQKVQTVNIKLPACQNRMDTIAARSVVPIILAVITNAQHVTGDTIFCDGQTHIISLVLEGSVQVGGGCFIG